MDVSVLEKVCPACGCVQVYVNPEICEHCSAKNMLEKLVDQICENNNKRRI